MSGIAFGYLCTICGLALALLTGIASISVCRTATLSGTVVGDASQTVVQMHTLTRYVLFNGISTTTSSNSAETRPRAIRRLTYRHFPNTQPFNKYIMVQ